MAQYGRPSSTITDSDWTPSTGTDLWACVDEVSASDTDYIRATGNSQTVELKLSTVTDPAVGTGHILRLRAMATGASGAERWTVTLYQGATLVATAFGNTAVSRSLFNDYSYTLSAAEADSITDYTDLRVRIVTSQGASETIDVSFIELEVPNVSGISATANITQGADSAASAGALKITGAAAPSQAADSLTATATIASGGTPGRVLVTWLEFKAPQSNTRSAVVNITQGADTPASTGTLKLAGALVQAGADNTSTAAGALKITGAANNTQAADTLAAVSTTAPRGTANITQAADGVAATGALKIAGTLAQTQAADTVGSAATLKLSAVANITAGGDTCGATATTSIKAAANNTQAANTITAAGVGQVSTNGAVSVTQANNTPAATATLKLAAVASPTQAEQTAGATGTLAAKGALAQAQAGNSITATGTLAAIPGANAAANVAQASNTIASTGVIAVKASGNVVSGADILSAAAGLKITGALNVTQEFNSLTTSNTLYQKTSHIAYADARAEVDAPARPHIDAEPRATIKGKP